MAKFRSKAVEIDAILWDGKLESLRGLGTWSESCVIGQDLASDDVQIETLEGIMTAKVGDWIIRGTEGELYPCKDSVFQRKYEAVE
jgi:hypothetical protein